MFQDLLGEPKIVSEISLTALPKTSILKIKTDHYCHKPVPEPTQPKFRPRKSLLEAVDSFTCIREASLKHLPSPLSQDAQDEDSLGACEEEEEDTDSIINSIEVEGDESAVSKGIQKNWLTKDEITDKCVQVPVPVVRKLSSDYYYPEGVKDFSDIYQNFDDNDSYISLQSSEIQLNK